MANKNYSEFPAGTINTADIILQGDPATGELEKIELSAIPNFGNTNLTATDDRQHEFPNKILTIVAGDTTFATLAAQLQMHDGFLQNFAQYDANNYSDFKVLGNDIYSYSQDGTNSTERHQSPSAISEFVSNGSDQKTRIDMASDELDLFVAAGADNSRIKLLPSTVQITTALINLISPNIKLPIDEATGVETKIYGEDIAENIRYAFKINPNIPILTVGSEEIGNEADHYNVAAFDDTSASLISVLTGTGTSALSVAPDQIFMQSTNYTFNAVQPFADNAAALAAGLTAGMIYRTGDLLKIVH